MLTGIGLPALRHPSCLMVARHSFSIQPQRAIDEVGTFIGGIFSSKAGEMSYALPSATTLGTLERSVQVLSLVVRELLQDLEPLGGIAKVKDLRDSLADLVTAFSSFQPDDPNPQCETTALAPQALKMVAESLRSITTILPKIWTSVMGKGIKAPVYPMEIAKELVKHFEEVIPQPEDQPLATQLKRVTRDLETAIKNLEAARKEVTELQTQNKELKEKSAAAAPAAMAPPVVATSSASSDTIVPVMEQKKIELLEKKLARREKDLSEKEKELSEKETKLTDLEKKVKDLEKSLKQAENKVVDYEDELSVLRGTKA